jgi:hypothetical protein
MKGRNTMKTTAEKTMVKINHEDRTIIITKAFAKEASTYGTPKYKQLMEIKNDNKDYKVVVKNTVKRKSENDHITLTDMRAYIEKHDSDKSIIEEFERMVNEKKGDNLKRTSFFAIKKWFFEQYPDLKSPAA